MTIQELQVQDDKVIVSVKIGYGVYAWHKAYGMTSNSLMSFDLEAFKSQVKQDAVVLIKDQELKDKALRRIKDVIGPEIILD